MLLTTLFYANFFKFLLLSKDRLLLPYPNVTLLNVLSPLKQQSPTFFCTTDGFSVTYYFQGPAVVMWRINTAKERDMKTGVLFFSIKFEP